ncbi:hypothetical protein [Streptomyces sp. NPDC046909]|uniref:hypothetical protein n=1 Tax=Streptomyces sp. NPDC046909 TaxID=3155617 RepID=UPI0033C46755
MTTRELRIAGVRRTCLVVDVEGYSKRLTDAAIDVQDRLLWTMLQACRLADVDPARCARQDQGDGQLLVLPPGIDEGHALPNALRGLRAALHRLNRHPGPGGRIRLRASLAQGLVYEAATGFAGVAVVHACRVLDSPQLRAALAGRADSDLAVAVTDDLYRDVLAQRREEPAAKHFAPMDASVPEKDFQARGWVYVPRSGGSRGLVPAYSVPTPPGSQPPAHRTCWGRGLAAAAGAAVAIGAGAWGVEEALAALGGGGGDDGDSDAHSGLAADDHTLDHTWMVADVMLPGGQETILYIDRVHEIQHSVNASDDAEISDAPDDDYGDYASDYASDDDPYDQGDDHFDDQPGQGLT